MQVMDKDNLIRNNMVAQVTCSLRRGTAQQGGIAVFTPLMSSTRQPKLESQHSATKACSVQGCAHAALFVRFWSLKSVLHTLQPTPGAAPHAVCGSSYTASPPPACTLTEASATW